MKWSILNRRHLRDVFLHSTGSGKSGDALYTLGTGLIRGKQTEAALWWCISLSESARHWIQTSQCRVRRNLNFSINHKQVTTHTHWISCMCICSDIQTLDKLTFTFWVLQVEIEGISKYSDKNVHTQTHTRMQTQRVVWVPVESTRSRPNMATVTLAKSQLQKLFISTGLRFPPVWFMSAVHSSRIVKSCKLSHE